MIKPLKTTYEYYHQKSDKTVSLRPVKLSLDLNRLYEWAHQPHVISQWKLNKTKLALYQHFRKALENKHQSLFIVAIDDNEFGYAEIYYAPQDRLANFCEVKPGDYGLHLFIGSLDALGQGYSELILATLTDYLFSCQLAKRVLVEPNQQVQQLTILQRKLGFANLGTLRLPEKIATLYAVEAAEFYQATPKQQKIVTPNTDKLISDTTDWPIVRIHFPDFPTDEMVINWLNEINQLLARNETCVVISTFAEHYQFSQNSRKHQALWFKKNTQVLANVCLAMIRVTQDQEMIAKITSNAMRKGMPFICIPANSVREAEKIAYRLLNKHKKSRMTYAS